MKKLPMTTKAEPQRKKGYELSGVGVPLNDTEVQSAYERHGGTASRSRIIHQRKGDMLTVLWVTAFLRVSALPTQ